MSSYDRTDLRLPELLSPAGNLEKLRIAFQYGADAAYIGGRVFGLRKYADNFTNHELHTAVDLANSLNKKIYVVLNGFAHDVDLDELGAHLDDLERIQPHGFIISDWGVAELAKRHTSVPLHVSTQASITNWRTVEAWKNFGATRVILAREVGIAECEAILDHCDIEIELFVHGAMCASYSGKCVISNYSAGRDANRGGCIQSCRHQYAIQSPDSMDVDTTAHIMNAKDLMGIRHIEGAIRGKIASLKIEGRMKSNLYVANATAAYRDAIDYVGACIKSGQGTEKSVLSALEARLSRVSNRTFSDGGLQHRPDAASIHTDFGGYQKSIEIAGTIRAVNGRRAMIQTKGPLRCGDTIQVHSTGTEATVLELFDMVGTPLEAGHAGAVIWAVLSESVAPYDILVTPEAA